MRVDFFNLFGLIATLAVWNIIALILVPIERYPEHQ